MWWCLDDWAGAALRVGDHDTAVDVVLRSVEACGAPHTSQGIDLAPELATRREDARVREALAVLEPDAVLARAERTLAPRMRGRPVPEDLRALVAASLLDHDEVTAFWWFDEHESPEGWGERRASSNLPISTPAEVAATAAANRAVHRHAIWVARGTEATSGIGYWLHPDVPAEYQDRPPVVFFTHDAAEYNMVGPGVTMSDVVVSLSADELGRDVEEVAASFRSVGVPVELNEPVRYDGVTPAELWEQAYRAALAAS